MAMGHKDDEQETLFVTHATLRGSAGHPFYESLEKILKAQGFDRYVEELCERFYKAGGRPSIPPLRSRPLQPPAFAGRSAKCAKRFRREKD